MLIPENEPHVPVEKIVWRTYPLRTLTGKVKNHDIIGWDTETYKGYARLIANSQGRYLLIEEQRVSEETFTRILNFLTDYKYRGTHGFFWNIDFDFFGIIKYAGAKSLLALYTKKARQNGKITAFYIYRRKHLLYAKDIKHTNFTTYINFIIPL